MYHSSDVRDYEVIICGAGVGGLSLAVALGRKGRRVLVIEKLRHEARVHRGELLQPRTLEILEEWGILPELRARGSLPIKAMEIRTAQGEYMGELNYGLLSEVYNYGLAQYYHEIKSAIRDVARDLVDISYQTRVVDLVRDGRGNVIGVRVVQGSCEQVITAHLIVGADGRTSHIRQLAGIPVDMFEYRHQLMGFDLAEMPRLRPRMCAFLSREGVRVLYPMPGGHARLYVQIKPGEFAQLKRKGAFAWQQELLATTPALRSIANYLPGDLSSAQLQGAWSYSTPIWSKGRVALIGDAAHYVHPTAGQGMNSAIIDAWSLAHALEEYSHGNELTPMAVEQALISYDARRREFDFVSALCHRMALFCTSTSVGRRMLTHWSLLMNRKNLRLQYRVMRNVAGYSARALSLIERMRQYGLMPELLTALLNENEYEYYER
jgi:2-polyprenyl-6-methoxyphenol hydroxylase-like FAD-dependent oxidoreductase